MAEEGSEIVELHNKPILAMAAFVSDDTQFTPLGTSAPTWVTPSSTPSVTAAKSLATPKESTSPLLGD